MVLAQQTVDFQGRDFPDFGIFMRCGKFCLAKNTVKTMKSGDRYRMLAPAA